jgi:hypothetical protein
MWEKFSIILSLCHMRTFSRNRFIGSFALSFLFSSTIGGFLGCARAIVFKRDKLETQLAILEPRQGHAHYKGITKEILFGGSIMPLAIIEKLTPKKPSFRPSKWPQKLKLLNDPGG